MARPAVSRPFVCGVLILGCSNAATEDAASSSSAATQIQEVTKPSQESASPADKEPSPSQWSKVTAMSGRVTVEFPAPATRQQQTVEVKAGPVSLDMYKTHADGVFWNLLIVTYPPSVVASHPDAMTFLRTRADGNEKQKSGATRKVFQELDDSDYWAAEHHFAYPSGVNREGGQYAAGFARHRHYLVDTSVVSVFVDVADMVYEVDPQSTDRAVERFFNSLVIRDAAPIDQ